MTFHSLTFAKSRGKLLKLRAKAEVFNLPEGHSPEVFNLPEGPCEY